MANVVYAEERPIIFNKSLPQNIRHASSITSMKTASKTKLFRQRDMYIVLHSRGECWHYNARAHVRACVRAWVGGCLDEWVLVHACVCRGGGLLVNVYVRTCMCVCVSVSTVSVVSVCVCASMCGHLQIVLHFFVI